jgi:two-component system response regulator YesN
MLQVLVANPDISRLKDLERLSLWKNHNFLLVAKTQSEEETLDFLLSQPIDILVSSKALAEALSAKIKMQDLHIPLILLDSLNSEIAEHQFILAMAETRQRILVNHGLKSLEEEKLWVYLKNETKPAQRETSLLKNSGQRYTLVLFHSLSYLKERLNNLLQDAIILQTGQNESLALFPEQPEWKDNGEGFLTHIGSQIEQKHLMVWDGYLTEPFDIRHAYEKLSRLSRYHPYFSDKTLITQKKIKQLPPIGLFRLSEEMETLRTLSKTQDLTCLLPHLESLYTCTIPELTDEDPLTYLNTQIMGLFLEIMARENLKPLELFGKPYIPIGEIFKLESTTEMYRWFQYALQKAQDLLQKQKFPRTQNEKVLQALRFIHGNYSSALNLDRIAEECNVHKVYLCRIFVREVGIPCHEYLLRLRVNKASTLLQETQENIKEIAHTVGFTSYDQFNKAFHRQKGMSPHSYRELEK